MQKNRPFERDQHPKHHGAVRAKFAVAAGLPDSLRVGLFREPKTYDAVVRFSNGASHVDNVPDVHGIAIKLLEIQGPSMLKDAADAGTQDFILIDHPVFFAIDSRDLVEVSAVRKAIAAGDTSKAGAYKRQLLLAEQFKSYGIPSPLEMSYFSTVPYALGKKDAAKKYAVKYSLEPDPNNSSGRPMLTKDSPPDALSAALIEHLMINKKPASFAFRVQLQTDPVRMPVEDPTVPWDSEMTTVATLTIEPQEFNTPELMTFCQDLSFTPWHSIEEHRPLGGINRSRRDVYEATSVLRHEKNGVPRMEPRLADVNRIYRP